MIFINQKNVPGTEDVQKRCVEGGPAIKPGCNFRYMYCTYMCTTDTGYMMYMNVSCPTSTRYHILHNSCMYPEYNLHPTPTRVHTSYVLPVPVLLLTSLSTAAATGYRLQYPYYQVLLLLQYAVYVRGYICPNTSKTLICPNLT